MSTKYKCWFNYDNDRKAYCLPVLPEKIIVKTKGETSSVTLDRLGEVIHKGKRGSINISFSSYFPPEYGESFCSCTKSQFKGPKKWRKWIYTLMKADKPMHFVLTGSPLNLNLYMVITSFQPTEEGGDVGTIHYTVELKEYRMPSVRIYKKTTNKVTGSSNKRVDNKETTNKYKVNCSALHLRTGPNATIIALMPRNTVVATDGKMNGNWLHVSYNGKWGYAYKSYLTQC